jgi:ribosomal protein S18 acetylase RimI-like enzyme
MLIRPFVQHDLVRLTELTIETFRPFYEDHFRPLVGETVFAGWHGTWRDDYREQVAALHDPEHHRYVAVAETGAGTDTGTGTGTDAGGVVAGYVAWNADPARGTGAISHLAVSAAYRRHRTGTALCEHAFGGMRALGVASVEIGTGGDPFHAPARALYESLGCTPLPVVYYYRQL